mgnify:CR=1 FL=1
MGREIRVVILGISQDGGFPQAGCNSKCCRITNTNPHLKKHPVSLGIIGKDGSKHLIEATRELAWQLNLWNKIHFNEKPISSLFITHAHHGHIDGLGLFGKEVINSKNLILNCSKSLEKLIKKTPNWNLLVESENIKIETFTNNIAFSPTENCGFKIKPIKIPHRAELSDMHAFLIQGPNKNLLFLPDHDTWEETLNKVNKKTIIEWFKSEKIDIALIDGTFWSSNELIGRDLSKIPHPTVTETLQLLGEKKNHDLVIKFIHLNHSNPLLNEKSEEIKIVIKMGWEVAKEGEFFTI